MVFKEILTELPGFLRGLFSHTEDEITKMMMRMERRVTMKGLAFKRFVTRSSVEIFVLLFGIGSFLLGLLVFLGRFAPIDVVMLVTGIVLVNIVLLVGKFK
jgi:hypothetical protein